MNEPINPPPDENNPLQNVQEISLNMNSNSNKENPQNFILVQKIDMMNDEIKTMNDEIKTMKEILNTKSKVNKWLSPGINFCSLMVGIISLVGLYIYGSIGLTENVFESTIKSFYANTVCENSIWELINTPFTFEPSFQEIPYDNNLYENQINETMKTINRNTGAEFLLFEGNSRIGK